jgi:subtilisin-like proprotein convertase family protein
MKVRDLSGVWLGLGLMAAGCGDVGAPEEDKGALVMPVVDAGGKGDVAQAVRQLGALGFGGDSAISGVFTKDLEFHGYTLTTRPGASVKLEVTQRGSSRSLDATLYVYGPKRADGSWGDAALAFDDDSGWGRLPKLNAAQLAAGGEYLVVVGTANGRGRGSYRLEATCASGECAPLPVSAAGCHPAIRAAIEACVADWEMEPDYDPSVTSAGELLAQCADVEPVAPAWDALCQGANSPAEVCTGGLEAFASGHLAQCARELEGERLDGTCVFGARYRDIFGGADALVVLERRVLTSADALTMLEEAQIVAAVQRTAYSDVMTAAQAFAFVDEGVVNQTVLWDASARRAFVAYEVGAGDNSFGAIFEHGRVTVAAEIIDGDLIGCTALWGAERRVCEEDGHCAEGLRCVGSSAASPRGRCVDLSIRAPFQMCDAQTACSVVDGLVCSGALLGGVGLCEQAWQRGTFTSEPALAIPDSSAAGVQAQLLAYGLATVSTDVAIELWIAHPRIADLRVTLTNPAGTEVPVFMGERDGQELYLRDVAVAGFLGDEAANGVWTLKVIDTRRGKVGTIERFRLTITSRWD